MWGPAGQKASHQRYKCQDCSSHFTLADIEQGRLLPPEIQRRHVRKKQNASSNPRTKATKKKAARSRKPVELSEEQEEDEDAESESYVDHHALKTEKSQNPSTGRSKRDKRPNSRFTGDFYNTLAKYVLFCLL